MRTKSCLKTVFAKLWELGKKIGFTCMGAARCH